MVSRRNDSLVDQLLVIGIDHGLIGGGYPILRQLGHRRMQGSRILIDNDLNGSGSMSAQIWPAVTSVCRHTTKI